MWKKSKTFCAYPWMHQMVQTNGKHSFCCVATDPSIKPEMPADEVTFEEARNSDFMVEMRRKMVNGEEVPECSKCYYEETIGRESYRLRHTNYWKTQTPDFDKRVDRSIQNGFKVDESPVYLDLRLGNLCNLKCRMCDPWNSSQMSKENKVLLRTDETFKSLWIEEHGGPPKPVANWFESDHFWEEVMMTVPHLKKIYLTGGEPTLISKNVEFLQFVVDQGYHHNIELFFNTNCTNLNERFLGIIDQYPNVAINCSIDGYDKMNDYIRFPSKWNSVITNFLMLHDRGHIDLGLTPVIQVYNVLSIVDLLEFADEFNIKVDLLVNHYPFFLSVKILPDSIRYLAADRIEQFVKSSTLCHRNQFSKNSIESVVNLLRDKRDERHEELMVKFINYTRSLDRIRKQSFTKYCPELTQMLHEEGYVYRNES